MASFAIYALVSKGTAWIDPIVSGVIIDWTGNTWKGFPFSLSLTVVGMRAYLRRCREGKEAV